MGAAPVHPVEEKSRLVSGPRATWSRSQRWVVLGLALLGAALIAVSYFLPYWHFALFAPQYPKGLNLVISLTGVTGDVQEIDIINHYIGMGHLGEAAKLERQLAAWGIGVAGAAIAVLIVASGRRLGWLATLPAVVLPLGFVLDTFYWMYRFGHELDPMAPITMKPFTPTLFGEGRVGQFRTLATPEWGFWLSLAGFALVVYAVVRRRRVCHACPLHDRCGLVCPKALVGVPGDPGVGGR
ncbi:cytochrome C [Myxococcota bacterium]|nr:cytochrome C [Myxococcota bacterium]